jgi:predicted Zn-dependent protease
MKTLPHPDNLHFEAAQGWLMLGDVASAQEELAQLSPASRDEPGVLEFAWGLNAQAQAWTEAIRVAERLLAVAPQRAFGWIHRAYALRRAEGGGLEQAWDALRPAFEKFPKQFLIPYNLACYAAQMGRPEEAWEWLQRAFAITKNPEKIRQMALADSDLEVLWPRLQERA